MIFVFVEDGTLEVIANAAEARRNYEGIDVESGVFRFYDEDGCFLEPIFTKPNRQGRIFGLISWCESGEFKLVSNPDAEEDTIGVCLHETACLAPNPWFESLEAVKQFLENRGVNVGLDLDSKESFG